MKMHFDTWLEMYRFANGRIKYREPEEYVEPEKPKKKKKKEKK